MASSIERADVVQARLEWESFGGQLLNSAYPKPPPPGGPHANSFAHGGPQASSFAESLRGNANQYASPQQGSFQYPPPQQPRQPQPERINMSSGSTSSKEKVVSAPKAKKKHKGIKVDAGAQQLHYHNFLMRIRLEATMRANAVRILLFAIHFVFFVCVLYVYDPIVTVGKAHEFLKGHFKMEKAYGVTDTNSILAYIQIFVEAAYQMSSALTDANTMDSIDASRCFSEETTDVCRLKYWSIPMDDSDQYADNYFNTTNLFMDKLSHLNYHPSVQHCDYPGAPSNCIRAAPTEQLKQRTYGLTPEDPIILNSREDYMFASVVPLAPLVWQTRGKREPCSGFGSTYNEEVLGAGQCTPDIECDPVKVTSFDNTQPNMETGRKQTIYVSYIEPAFVCVNRFIQDEEVFYDKSWFPWGTYEDLSNGHPLEPADFGGSMVYWKFISDVAYLQAPYLGINFVRDDPAATQFCMAGDPDSDIHMACNGYGDPANCSDPVKMGPDHHMWHETKTHTLYQCSLHEEWNKRFLEAKDPATWPDNRKSTFVTFETSSVAVAALVVSPRIDALPDMQSYVRVIFSFDSSGYITVSAGCMTTSQTFDVWYTLVYCEWVAGGIYMLNALSNRKTVTTNILVFDLLSVFSAVVYVLMNWIIDSLPPHISEELEKAFEQNQQTAYFQVFQMIYSYNLTMHNLRTAGFFVVLVLFYRLQLYLAVHPKLAVLVNTLQMCADDLFHFSIFLSIIICVFGFLGTWSFGTTMPAYGSFDRAMYQLFRMFTGDALFGENDKLTFSYIVYLMLFVCIVFITLLNFLLAIIVNAYTEVETLMDDNQTEQNVVSDLVDAFKGYYIFFSNGWPAPDEVANYLGGRKKLHPDQDEEEYEDGHKKHQLGVTAEELLEGLTYLDPKTEQTRRFFKNMKSASAYVEFYAKKLYEDGEYVLVEYRDEWCQRTISESEAEMERTIEETAEKLWSIKTEGKDNPESVLGQIKTRYMQKRDVLAIEDGNKF